ncbi:hypothetical protein H1P_590005 [Hyella patelloides LEGE 07179]|uniref:Uncharacterized protein n=1 Tax=Hyella patelloides LEGE 07179 TaxID=945734 RepID=A0A563W196_9CYAN|nr:hypothetical protein H1P_590005 [Hyella patelloides LEGE 07179]
MNDEQQKPTTNNQQILCITDHCEHDYMISKSNNLRIIE